MVSNLPSKYTWYSGIVQISSVDRSLTLKWLADLVLVLRQIGINSDLYGCMLGWKNPYFLAYA